VINEHAAALIALLTGAGLTVHDGAVPAGVDVDAEPYLKPYFDSADPESTKEAAPYRFEMTMTLHCVAGNAGAARILAGLARTALVQVVPTVAGRTCFPITREAGSPARQDETTGRLVMDQIDLYILRSLPG
jgi:hypothetical protein